MDLRVIGAKDSQEFMTRKEAAAELGVSLLTVARMLDRGDLTRYKLRNGHHVRVDVAEVRSINERKTAAATSS